MCAQIPVTETINVKTVKTHMEMLVMKNDCLKCAYLTEKTNGEHCGKCIRTAKDNFKPANNMKINLSKEDNTMKIKIKYHTDIETLEYIGGEKSNWIDLRAAETVFIPENEYRLISLGVSMELPEGYEAYVVPRSSTFKRWGIIQANGVGIIDSSFKGTNDIWRFPAYCLEGKDIIDGCVGTIIKKNDRICQFRIMKKQPDFQFVSVDKLDNDDRGGIGSTGVR